MIIKRLIYLLAFILPVSISAQGKLDIQKPDELKRMLADRMQERSKSDAKVLDGYRILLYFSEDRNSADNLKSRFINDFSNNFECDVEWDEPKFKVYAGLFTTRAEAVELLYLVREKYPNAMIVRTKIRNPKL